MVPRYPRISIHIYQVPTSFRWSLCLSVLGLNRLRKFNSPWAFRLFQPHETSSTFILRHPTLECLRRGTPYIVLQLVLKTHVQKVTKLYLHARRHPEQGVGTGVCLYIHNRLPFSPPGMICGEIVLVRFLVVCFLYKTNPNPRRIICCGKNCHF